MKLSPEARRHRLIETLTRLPNRYRAEANLQNAVAALLTAAGIEHEREATIGDGSRIDFLSNGTGIECKTRGAPDAVHRQIYRYANHISDLILITTKAFSISTGTIRNSHNLPVTLHIINVWTHPQQ